MSFAKDSKLEIIENDIEDAGCAQAFLAGLFHACGNLNKNASGVYLELATDFKEIYNYINKIISRLYGIETKLEISDDYTINKTAYYKIIFPIDLSTQILKDCCILSQDGQLNLFAEIDSTLIPDDECKKSFIKGSYIGCATSSIKLSTLGSRSPTTGYHLEFASHNEKFLLNLQNLLNNFNIFGKIAQRKKVYVLYFKDSEAIKDLLALVGANMSVMELSDEMAKRYLRNTVNRQVNCINANISKTVDASLKQITAINYINHKIGLESLPEDLQEVAVLRLANPQESMEELLKLSTIKLTKSGLNHRFRRIIKIADFLKEK